MRSQVREGLTTTGYRLVFAITALSVAHHVDHVLRGVTGWPFNDQFNAFSGSLFVYPVIALGLFMSKQGRLGPLFWSFLAGGGALFILVVHVGPAAGDDVADLPSQHDSAVAAVLSLLILGAFFGALIAHCLYEARRLARHRR